MTTDPVLVLQTWFVADRYSDGHYEIEIAAAPWQPRLTVVTRDRDLYQDCLDLEGRDCYVVARYHDFGDERVLEAIAPAPMEARR